MAYDPNQQDPNQQQNQGMPTTSSAPGAGPATGKGGAPQATPAQPFQNLSAYLSANQPQVNAQADKIAGDLSSQYGQTKTAIDQGQQAFGTQVQSGYTAPNNTLVNSAAANPTDFVSNPDNVKAFQSLYNDQYTGPSSYESTTGYGNVNAAVNKAVNNANLVGSDSGIQTYFQGQNPNATKGGNTLDAVLLKGTPEAYGKVTAAAKPFASLMDYLNGTVTSADQGVTAAQKAATDTAAGVQGQFTGPNGVIPTFQSDLSGRVSKAQTDMQSLTDKAIADIKAGKPLDWNEAQALGTRPEDISTVGNLAGQLKNDYQIPFDISSFINTKPASASITPANFATTSDYEKAAALSKLTGQDLSSFLDPGNSKLAGTAPKNLGTVNSPGAIMALNDAIAQHDQQFLSKNPMPAQDPSQKTFQMNLIARNPQLLQNINWSLWYQRNGGHVPPPSSPYGPIPPPNTTPPDTRPIGFTGSQPGIF